MEKNYFLDGKKRIFIENLLFIYIFHLSKEKSP